MDNAAMIASVELAAGKARAAALFKKPSQDLEEAIDRGRYAAITARGFVEMQGALPVVVDGEVVGAIGASFATPSRTSRSRRRGWSRSASDCRARPGQMSVGDGHHQSSFETSGRTAGEYLSDMLLM